ncbi:MAG TPA: cysteine hydrolase family protein [Chitinispirillaceae bacterium]|nr:cysteine hydrolase family protein [Chitinispirillaceae bacterium]
MAECLLLIDLQNDYFEEGNIPLTASIEAVKNARRLLDSFRGIKRPVCHVKHINIRPGATYLLRDTTGCEIHEMVKPNNDEMVITKHYPNSFRETGLLEFLENNKIDSLIICGMMTHMCIDTTTRAAFDLGFRCTVVNDACTTKDLEFKGKTILSKDVHNAFMASLKGIFAKVVSTEEYLAEIC